MRPLKPLELTLALSLGPYLLLNIAANYLGFDVAGDVVIVFSGIFLGFVAGASATFIERLKELGDNICGLFVDETERRGWQESMNFHLDSKWPLYGGFVIGLGVLPVHYMLYGEAFIAKYSLVLYALNALLLFVPTVGFLSNLLWMQLVQYFWIYGLDPFEEPPRLGAIPPKLLQRFLKLPVPRPRIQTGLGSGARSDLEAWASLAIFGSILVGMGGAIIIPIIMYGLQQLAIQVLLVLFLVIFVMATFFYPMKKIYDLMRWEKVNKIRKINTILEVKAPALEALILDSSSKEKLTADDLSEIEFLSRYIETVKNIEKSYTESMNLPIDKAVIMKLFASAMAPIGSFLAKNLGVF